MVFRPELAHVISDFLCTECKSPLYVEVGSENNVVCPNPGCVMHPSWIRFYDVTKSEELKREINEIETKLFQRISETSRYYFVNYLYMKRKKIIEKLLKQRKAHFRELLSLDDFLIYVASNPPNGVQQNLGNFESILSDYRKHFDIRCFIEDLANSRYLMSNETKPYALKYWTAVLHFYQTQGIVAGFQNIAEAFRYSEIEEQSKEQIELKFGQDWGQYFQQLFPFIIRLGYMFEYQYFTAQQHRYDPTGIDIAALLGLWVSAKQDVDAWSFEGIKRHYEHTSAQKEPFDTFYEKYISGRSLAPIIVFNGRNYLFDKYTTLLYSLYLIGKNQQMSPGQDTSGSRAMAEKREKASGIFEDKVREQLRKAGFSVPSKPLIVREQNEEHEYDAIGVNEAKREIIITEAKYRDFAPSSISGITLVKQELLDKDRLLDWVIDSQRKLEFFQRYGDRFERELSLEKEIENYSIIAWIITKHRPLISKYRDVKVIDFWDFCKILSNSLAK